MEAQRRGVGSGLGSCPATSRRPNYRENLPPQRTWTEFEVKSSYRTVERCPYRSRYSLVRSDLDHIRLLCYPFQEFNMYCTCTLLGLHGVRPAPRAVSGLACANVVLVTSHVG